MEKKEVTKEKLTYEELNNVCHQLSEQSRALYQQLQEANLSNVFKRLDYLFAVVENAKNFPNDFVTKCVGEIIEMLTIPEKKEEGK